MWPSKLQVCQSLHGGVAENAAVKTRWHSGLLFPSHRPAVSCTLLVLLPPKMFSLTCCWLTSSLQQPLSPQAVLTNILCIRKPGGTIYMSNKQYNNNKYNNSKYNNVRYNVKYNNNNNNVLHMTKTSSWVHSSVVRAADCRSAGPWFKSGCALILG